MLFIMKIKIKNISHRYDVNRPRPRHEYQCASIKSVSV